MKTLLQIKGIHKSYGAEVIMDDLSVSIAEHHKIGVIGRNGAGKSTLCKLIVGLEAPDSGTILRHPGMRLAYLEQHDPYRLDETVIEFLMRYTEKEEWECGKVAARFQLKNELLETEIGELPGGFRTRVKLTSMLLRDPNLLILDEPTNYLDLRTLILLEEFLRDFRGAFIIVSHDREFLKKTCTETLEIENGVCALYPGTVDQYLVFKEEQARLTDCYNKNIVARRKHLQTFIDRFGATASKAGQARSMMKQMEKLKTIETDHPLGTVRLVLPNIEKRNLVSFRCDDLAIGYPEREVASGITMEFMQGAHIAVLGDNGQGKTTFMRTIAGDLEARAGTYKWGHNLKIGYYAQHVLLSLDPRDDVYSHLSRVAGRDTTKQDLLALAGGFLFRDEEILKKIAVLSGGEKARVCLAGLLLSKSDVLLLDEPTNHLDFETVEALGRALKKFNGSVFFISHDRTFVNLLASEIVEVNNGAVLKYPGAYEEYVYAIEAKFRDELEGGTLPVKRKEARPHVPLPLHTPAHKETHGKEEPAPRKPVEDKAKRDRTLVKRLKTERVRVSSQIQQVHARVERHKKEREEILQLFSNDSTCWTMERNARYEYLEKVIREEEDRWLELTEKAENLAKKIDEIASGRPHRETP